MAPSEAGGTGRDHQRRVGEKAPVAVEAKTAKPNLLRPGGEKGIAHQNDGPDGRFAEGQGQAMGLEKKKSGNGHRGGRQQNRTYLKKNLSAPGGVPRVAGFSICFFVIQCIVNRLLAEP
ncbi:MAG: hypothetical protein QNI97_08635 [Desulfobacterales bacterium]|nr:hypothetical protein [Desulfobacterales bacterium]